MRGDGDRDPLELGRAHTDDYLAAVRVAGSGRSRIDLTGYGLGNDDNPIFLRMHEAAASLVGSTLTGAKAIAAGATHLRIGTAITGARPAHG